MQDQAPNQQPQPAKAPPGAAAKVVSSILVLGVAGYAAQQFLTTPSMQDIENKVAMDAVAQYEIVKRSGDAMQMCAHAGLVSAAFVQAKDEANFKLWHETEKGDCAKAGVPK